MKAADTPPLTPCPLHPEHAPVPYGDGMSVCCANKMCPLGDTAVLPDEWRRLAAPPLDPTIVEVLRAIDAVRASIAAGRPGLRGTE